MHKCIVLLLIALFSFSIVYAQYDENNSTESDTGTTDVMETSQGNLTVLPSKFVIALLSIILMVGFYFLLLSNFSSILDKDISPLTAAATQCLKFCFLVALILLLALFALSGFVFSNLGQTFANNLGMIIFIAVIWFAYFIITISNKGKGEAK